MQHLIDNTEHPLLQETRIIKDESKRIKKNIKSAIYANNLYKDLQQKFTFIKLKYG